MKTGIAQAKPRQNGHGVTAPTPETPVPQVVVVIGRTAAGELRFVPVTVPASAKDLQAGDHHERALAIAAGLGITAGLSALDAEFAREAISGLQLLGDLAQPRNPRPALEQLLEPFSLPVPSENRPHRPRG